MCFVYIFYTGEKYYKYIESMIFSLLFNWSHGRRMHVDVHLSIIHQYCSLYCMCTPSSQHSFKYYTGHLGALLTQTVESLLLVVTVRLALCTVVIMISVKPSSIRRYDVRTAHPLLTCLVPMSLVSLYL